MKAKHLSTKSQNIWRLKTCLLFVLLSLLFVMPFCLNNVVFADNNGQEAKASETYIPFNPDYATAKYWDEHYGPQRTYLHQSDFTPGCIISAGTYFINENISVQGKGSNTGSDTITPAIIISGDVNIYLEKTDSSEEGPTLTFIGGNSNTISGAAAGIELQAGNSLHFYGTGTVNASGGSWNGADAGAEYPKAGVDGEDGWGGFIFLVTISGGDSGAGSDGFGGSAAGIGTNGGKGGNGGKQVEGPQDSAGSKTSSGIRGNDGGVGGNTNNAGDLFCFGNVIINAKAGSPVNVNFKRSGSYGKGFHLGSISIAASFGGGGGGGGIGGAGWKAAAIGSGGAGGGGGASGGTGGTEFNADGHHEGKKLYPHGGGGGNGASGVFHSLVGGGGNPELTDMDIAATSGGFISPVTSLNNNNSNGGNGTISTPSGEGARDGGDGGNGGTGGNSGSGGSYYSTYVESAHTNASDNRAEGTSPNIFKRFLESLCGLVFYDSLVDWCGAYLTDDVNPVEPQTDVCESSSATILKDDENKYSEPSYENNIESGHWATVNRTGIKTADEGAVVCKDNLVDAGLVTDKFFLVRKGKVDVELESRIKLYDGLPIYVDHTMVKVSFDGKDVTSELFIKNFDVKFYKVDGDKLIPLSYPPTDAGTYRVQVYVYSKDYIGRSNFATYQIAKKDASIQALNTYVKVGEQPPELRATVYGTIEGEEFVQGLDYTLAVKPTEEKNVFLITPVLVEGRPILNNYFIECIEGYLVSVDPGSEASLSVVIGGSSGEYSIEYGFTNLPKLEVNAEGFTVEEPVEGVDYEFVYDSNIKDVGDYIIGIKLKLTPTIMAQKVNINTGILHVIRKDAQLTVNDTSKTYGDNDPDFDVTVVGIVDGEKFIEGEGKDYTISGNDSEDAGTYTLTATVNENGPVARNYNVTTSTGQFIIKRKDAYICADDILNGYGLLEKPLTLTQVSGFVKGDILKEGVNEDYSLSREHGPGTPESAGKYKITVTVHNDGAVAKNYNLSESKEAFYTIREKYARVSALDASSVYGDQDSELKVQATGLVGDDPDKFKVNDDYKIWRDFGKDAGEYTIYIEIIDDGPVSKNYYFNEVNTATYTITKKPASVSADDINQVYGERTKKLTITQEDFVPDDILHEGDEEDYTISREDPENVNAGTYEITLTVNPEGPVAKNYSLTVKDKSTYTIEKADVNIKPYNSYKIYGDIDPEFRARVYGTKFEEEFTYGVDYSLYREEGEDAGAFYLISCEPHETEITANYNIETETGNFTIVGFNAFEKTDVAPIEPLVYLGQPLCPDFDVTFDFNKINWLRNNGDRIKKFEKDKDYVITYVNNDKPGIATALITGIGSCSGEKKVDFLIVDGPGNPEEINVARTFDNMTDFIIPICFIILASLCVLFVTKKQHSSLF